MTSVFTVEALEQAAGSLRLEAGEALHAAGRVTRVAPRWFGVSGIVDDDAAEHQVWVGIRHWMLVASATAQTPTRRAPRSSTLRRSPPGVPIRRGYAPTRSRWR